MENSLADFTRKALEEARQFLAKNQNSLAGLEDLLLTRKAETAAS
jgi:hypothetical protein